MTAFSTVYTLHLLAALVWVGGMFFAWMVLRPAVIAALEGPSRLKVWVQVFPRFFVWVWAAVVLLPITGIGMIQLNFTGFETAPRYVQIMMGLYVVMVALFLRIHSLQLPELRSWLSGLSAISVRALPTAHTGPDQSTRKRSDHPH